MHPLLVLALSASIVVAVELPPVATDPTLTRPSATGTAMPSVTLRNAEGTSIELASIWATKPAILVVYRGSWCPYCVRQLAGLQAVAEQLQSAGWNLVAVSPDRPERLTPATPDGITRLSDQDATLIRSLGLAFRLDDQTIATYKGYGIDLTEASGRDHQALPIPAVLLIDTAGTVRFIHADADYRKRLDPAALMAAAQSIAASTQP